MLNKINFLIFCAIILVAFSNSQPYLPNFRLEIWRDSVYIDEPLIFKCWLINNSIMPIKVWDRGPIGLLTTGSIDFYLITAGGDTHRYTMGIDDFSRQMPSLEIPPNDSMYWYSVLSWHNFVCTSVRNLSPGQFRIFARYGLTIKDPATDSIRFPIIRSNEVWIIAGEIPDSERVIYDEWIPLTHDYFWWGERFERIWVRDDYNELCKQVADMKSRFAIYAHYIYCKSTGDKKEMQKFLERYPGTPLAEMIEFLLDVDKAQKKYPLNFFAKRRRHD